MRGREGEYTYQVSAKYPTLASHHLSPLLNLTHSSAHASLFCPPFGNANSVLNVAFLNPLYPISLSFSTTQFSHSPFSFNFLRSTGSGGGCSDHFVSKETPDSVCVLDCVRIQVVFKVEDCVREMVMMEV
jgi:hypothetical protein